MRKLFCGAVLLCSVLLANTALGYYGDYGGYGSDFDSDLFFVGGEIIPGNDILTKVKIVSKFVSY